MLVTFRDFEGHTKTHRSPKEDECVCTIIPKGEWKVQANFIEFHIIKDKGSVTYEVLWDICRRHVYILSFG